MGARFLGRAYRSFLEFKEMEMFRESTCTCNQSCVFAANELQHLICKLKIETSIFSSLHVFVYGLENFRRLENYEFSEISIRRTGVNEC